MGFVVVHLKARGDPASQARRRDACQKLDALVDARPDQELVVMGDFNDRLTDAGSDNVFDPFLSDPQQYRFLTAPLAQVGAFSYVPFRSLIDHILVTDETLAGRKPPQTSVPRLDLSIPDYLSVISDHLPIVSTLSVR
jgi:endonuclease/exonuclease/phosphatase family metal-dependent hydrolase